jgi:hypothetical protein
LDEADEIKPGDVERELEREMYRMYERGHVTASEYHHVVDRHYEERHGIAYISLNFLSQSLFTLPLVLLHKGSNHLLLHLRHLAYAPPLPYSVAFLVVPIDYVVILAFVEEDQGEREERLRKEIEGDVGTNPNYDEDGIVDRDGNVILLHRMDRRAVEFRERLRTW